MIRRILLLLTVVAVTAAMMVVMAAPAFAEHRCIVENPPGDTSCPDEHATEGLSCAALASESRSPFPGVAVCRPFL